VAAGTQPALCLETTPLGYAGSFVIPDKAHFSEASHLPDFFVALLSPEVIPGSVLRC